MEKKILFRLLLHKGDIEKGFVDVVVEDKKMSMKISDLRMAVNFASKARGRFNLGDVIAISHDPDTLKLRQGDIEVGLDLYLLKTVFSTLPYTGILPADLEVKGLWTKGNSFLDKHGFKFVRVEYKDESKEGD